MTTFTEPPDHGLVMISLDFSGPWDPPKSIVICRHVYVYAIFIRYNYRVIYDIWIYLHHIYKVYCRLQ